MIKRLKTIWPFNKYYQAKADVEYYQQRHSDLNDILNTRIKENNKYQQDIKKLLNEKITLIDRIGEVEGQLMLLKMENRKLAESISDLTNNLCKEDITEQDKVLDDGFVVMEESEENLQKTI